MTHKALVAGALVHNRYRVDGFVGHGAQSEVFAATDLVLGLRRALKRARHGSAAHLLREHVLLADIHHPNIAGVEELLCDPAFGLVQVQELAEGPELLAWCASVDDVREICRAVAAAARALSCLHLLGVTHGDVKPSNLRVSPWPIGRLPGVRLIDFGFARSARPWSLPWSAPTLDGMTGTPGYAAPEVLAGAAATPAADIYALGCTLYEALTGRLVDLADARKTPVELAPAARLTPFEPRQLAVLRELLTDMLALAPDRRPSANAVLVALGGATDESLPIDDDELCTDYFPRAPVVGRDAALVAFDGVLVSCGDPNATGPAVVTLAGSDAAAVAVVARALARGRGWQLIDVASMARATLAATRRMPPSTRDPAEESERARLAASRLIDGWSEPSGSVPVLLDLGAAVAEQAAEPHSLIVAEVGRQLMLAQSDRANEPRPRLLALRTEPDAPSGSVAGGAPGELVLALPPLAEHDATALVRALRSGRSDPPWLQELIRRTGGDPRLLLEQVRAQIEAHDPPALVGSAGTAPALSAALTTRLLTLPAAQRELLEAIALCHEPLRPEVIDRLAPRRVDALPALLAHGWITVDEDGGVRPREAAIARAVATCEDRPAGEVMALHVRLADAFEALVPRRDDLIDHHRVIGGDFSPELLSRAPLEMQELDWVLQQLELGSDGWLVVKERTARLLRFAGQLEPALTIAEAIEAVDQTRGVVLRAELLLEAGQPARASQVLAALPKATATATPERRLLAARTAFLQHDYEGAERAADALATSADAKATTDPTTTLALLHLSGLAAVYRGEAARGLARLLTCEARARQHGQRELLPRLLNSQGIAYSRLGRADDASRALEGALSAAKDVGDVRIAATAALNLGTARQRERALARALELFREARTLAARAGIGTTQVSALANEANLMLMFGERSAAASLLEDAARLAERVGAPALCGHVALYRAELWLEHGRAEAAHAELRRAREQLGADDVAGQQVADLLECELWLAQGDAQAVERLSARLSAALSVDDPERWRLHLCTARGALLRAQSSGLPPADTARGSPEFDAGHGRALVHAAAELDLSLALSRRSGSSELVWYCHALAAKCASDLGRSAEAAWHAAQCTADLLALRDAVPPAHRAALDGRPRVIEARRMVDELRASGALATDVFGTPVDQPQAADLERLLKLNTELSRGLPVRTLLDRILDCALELTGAERGFVLLRKDTELTVAASRNVDGESLRRGMQRLSTSIAERAILQRQPVVAADAMSDERFAERLSVAGLRLRAVLCVPLAVGSETRGALYIDNRFQPNAFGPRAVALLQAFADQAAVALFSAELFEDLARHRDALSDAKAEVERLNLQLEQRVARQSEQLSEMGELLRRNDAELVRRYNAANIIGKSKPMRALFAQIDRLTDADVSVYIRGESGTGKELVARAIHFKSVRASHPFVSLNCAAIPPSLVESELFGHARGAFTGALRDRAGLFEAAGEGTLLLDEIGDMPADMQVKLLRLLQERNFRRLGDNTLRPSQCRVLAAGQQRLEELVEQGRFREDLYYRLCVVQVAVPPLRERREDIPLLVAHIVEQFGAARTVSAEAMAALMDFDWPGNVRQLENELHRAIVLTEGPILLSALSPVLVQTVRRPSTRQRSAGARGHGDALGSTEAMSLGAALRDAERQLLVQALDDASGNVSHAAKRLGISRVALHRKIRKLGILRRTRTPTVSDP